MPDSKARIPACAGITAVSDTVSINILCKYGSMLHANTAKEKMFSVSKPQSNHRLHRLFHGVVRRITVMRQETA